MYLTALTITNCFLLQFKMEGLEDYLHEKEEIEREKHKKMLKNDPTGLEDAEKNLDLEIEVKY